MTRTRTSLYPFSANAWVLSLHAFLLALSAVFPARLCSEDFKAKAGLAADLDATSPAPEDIPVARAEPQPSAELLAGVDGDALAYNAEAPSRAIPTDLGVASVDAVEAPAGSETEPTDSRAIRPKPARRFTLPPWMTVRDLTPEFSSSESLRKDHRAILPPWAYFDDESRFEGLPDLFDAGYMPLLYCPPPRETRFTRAIKKIARKKLFREVRRWMKRQWRQAFRGTPSMSYAFYEERLKQIRKVGRDPREAHLFDQNYFTDPLKDEFRRPDREVESHFPMFSWGPVVVFDSGSVRLDFGRILGSGSRSLDEVKLEDEKEPTHDPILCSEDHRIRASVRLDFNPFRAYRESDFTRIIDRYGLGVEVDWFSDVLGRNVMTTEFEVEFEREGEFAAVVNFVVKGRR